MNPPLHYVGAGALIHKDGKLLLVKRNQRPDKGMWSFPGGAVELGETTEEAAVREVREETGLDIKIESLFDVVTYLPSKAERGHRIQVIVVDYLAVPQGGRMRRNQESSDIGWFSPAQIQKLRTIRNIRRCSRKFARMGIL